MTGSTVRAASSSRRPYSGQCTRERQEKATDQEPAKPSHDPSTMTSLEQREADKKGDETRQQPEVADDAVCCRDDAVFRDHTSQPAAGVFNPTTNGPSPNAALNLREASQGQVYVGDRFAHGRPL